MFIPAIRYYHGMPFAFAFIVIAYALNTNILTHGTTEVVTEKKRYEFYLHSSLSSENVFADLFGRRIFHS